MRLVCSPPEPLTAQHFLADFDSGEPALDEWLRHRALKNQTGGASRTFVVADDRSRVRGFYSLSAGAVTHEIATPTIRRNMPEPIPVIVLGRLAVDRRMQGMKLGGALLKNAVERCVSVSQQMGVRAMLVHAINPQAKQFYEHYGFRESPQQALTLMLKLDAARG